MPDQDELTTLRQRVAELERQLAEEREEFEWDLKAAREGAEATIHKLEAQLKELQESGGAGEDADMLARRAMKAERRVSELEYELKKLRREARPRPSQDDSFLKQRAEEAERERDKLRRQVGNLERQLGELRQKEAKLNRQLAERERVIERLANDAERATRAESQAETEHRQRIAELERQLAQRDQRISELASELNQLGMAESERQRLADECQRLQEQVQQDRQRIEQLEQLNEEHVEQLAETSKRAEVAENELARLKLASGQMMEQRERETERLKSDLAEAERRDAQAAQRQGHLQQQLENTRLELEKLRIERDQAVEELRRLRDRQITQVAPTPQAEKAPGAADPFAESTVKAPYPAGAQSAKEAAAEEGATVRDGVPLGARSAPPAGDDAGPAEPPEPSGAASAASTPEEAPGASGIPAAVETDSETVISSDDEDERIAVEWLQSGPARRTRTGTEVVRRQGEKEKQVVDTAPLEEVGFRKPGRRFPGVVPAVLLAAAGLVYGAWHYFPRWFGPDTEEETSSGSSFIDHQSANATSTEPAPAADAGVIPADGSVPAAASGADEMAAAAAPAPVAEAPAPSTEPAGTAASRPAPPGPAQLKLYKVLDRKLKRRKYVAVRRLASRALKRFPDDARLHYYYGRALFYRKQRRQALEELQQAVRLDPELVPAYYELIGLNLVLGRRSEACQAAAKYLELSGGRSRRARAVKHNLRKMGCR